MVAISACVPSWLENLTAGYLDNAADKELLCQLSLSQSSPAGFSLIDGVIRYKGRIWVGHNELAQNHVLQALYNSGIDGHSGIQGTYHKIKSLFA